jgi:hypothetical protein
VTGSLTICWLLFSFWIYGALEIVTTNSYTRHIKLSERKWFTILSTTKMAPTLRILNMAPLPCRESEGRTWIVAHSWSSILLYRYHIFTLGLILYPEDGSSKFFRSICNFLANWMTSQSTIIFVFNATIATNITHREVLQLLNIAMGP